MKYFALNALLFVLCVFFLITSCSEEKEYILQPAPSKIEGLADEWELKTIYQIDRSQKLILEPVPFDVTNVLLANGATASASFTAQKTYTLNLGDMPNYIGTTTGSWAFDDELYPSKIILNGLDTLALLKPTRPIDKILSVEVVRTCAGVPTVAYQFDFERK